MNKPTFHAMLAQYSADEKSGEGVVSWENGARCVIPEVIIGGKAEQKQYSGKNLFVSIPNQTLNGVTLTQLPDGGYLLNGTCTASNNFSVAADLGAAQYSFGCRYEGTLPDNSNIRAQVYVSSPYFSRELTNRAGVDAVNVGTLTADGRAMFRIRIDVGFAYNNVKLWPILVLGEYTSDTMPQYEPYTGGVPAPNPDYPIMPVFSEGTTVESRGKNLLNVEMFNLTDGLWYNPFIASITETSITVTTTSPTGNGYTATNTKLKKLAPNLEVGKTYVLSMKSSVGKSYVHLTASAFTWTDGKSRTMTEDDLNSEVILYGSTGVGDCHITNFQIELASTPTDYAPYFDGGTATAPALLAIPGTEYRDTWDVRTGKGVRRCAVIESYAGQSISTPYISSTGQLSEGAFVVYGIPDTTFQTFPQPLTQQPGSGQIIQTDGTLDNCPITVKPVTHS